MIGGGPSGSYSALTAARLGAEVLVCEEHEQIGAPKHCAGHLNISGLQRLGIRIPRSAVENEIKGAVFHSPSGKEFMMKCNNPVSYVVDRELFDKHIAELAVKAGAEYHFKSRVKTLFINSEYVRGVGLKGEKRIESDVVIDAEGCSSSLLKKTGLNGLKAFMTVSGIQVEVDRIRSVEEDMVEVFFGRKVAPGFYAWIIPRKDGTAKVGLATSMGNPQHYLRRFVEKHPVASKKLRKTKVTDVSVHPIPLAGPIPKTYSNGFLAVGDAASQVKATTGGGVIFGLLCAREAGKVAHEAVENQDFSEAFLADYQRRWRQLIGFELSAMLRMRKMLDSLSDNRVDRIIDLCNRLGVNGLLERFGDLDFQGRSLIPMMRYPGTLAVLIYFFGSWLISSSRPRVLVL